VAALLTPFLLALVLAVLIGGPIIGLLRKLRARQIISTDAPEGHQKKAGTPSMGGLIFLLAALAAALIAGPVTSNLLGLALVTVAFAGIGFLDDLLIVLRGRNLGLKARQKLALQFFVGLLFLFWYHGAALEGSSASPALGPLLLLGAFQLLLIVAMSNAVNLTDGLDGLASGLAVPLWLVLGVVAHLAPQFAGERMGWDHGVATCCMALAGACLGFLWFNSHPAAVFMGDTGSLALGGGMAAAAILLRAEVALLIAGLVYLAEAASVTLQVISFKTTGKRIFRMSPLHHHFELVGWAETTIVGRFRILGVACAVLALLWLLRA
jgi:phospho-N-acetylmuramoyl-pentapeptide-transferase